jgi:magnesium-transporting ATPase (P-type)
MLTGDKVETAKCIAITTGLKKDKRKFFQIVHVKVAEKIK